jgi:hypothetical protein
VKNTVCDGLNICAIITLFLMIYFSLKYLRNFAPFMKFENVSPWPLELTAAPYPEGDESSIIFTNCIFSLHNIFYYSNFTTCFDSMWSSSGITYSYNHLDIGFYFPYTGQCLHVRKVLKYMYALLWKFLLHKIKLL